jgi:small subunit ribosomal protein S7
MPRRAKVARREMPPDAKYHSTLVARFICKVMMQGRKATAERIVYQALQIAQDGAKRDPVDLLEQAIKNVTPLLEVKPRRVGGATYQVPVEVRANRGLSLAMRWLVQAAKARGGRAMAEKLAAEVVDASQGQGASAKRRENVHKMAEANRAFVHYRW